jgi:hypothetical protein
MRAQCVDSQTDTVAARVLSSRLRQSIPDLINTSHDCWFLALLQCLEQFPGSPTFLHVGGRIGPLKSLLLEIARDIAGPLATSNAAINDDNMLRVCRIDDLDVCDACPPHSFFVVSAVNTCAQEEYLHGV